MQQVLGRLDANRDVAAADMVCKAWRALKTPYPALRKYDTINVSTLNWIKANRNRVMSFAFNLSSKKAVQRSTIGSELLLLGLLGCPALSSLTIKCRALEAIPPQSLLGLTSLQHLTIADCAGLTRLPDEMSALSALLSLKIQRNMNLTRLPASLGKLQQLQELQISGDYDGIYTDRLCSLPESLGQLSRLTMLSIVNCSELTQLPQSITQLSKLRHLSVTACQSMFHPLPEQGLAGLQSLTLLEFRACSTSYGCRLPAGLSELTSLQVLSTSRYRLPPALPASNSLTHICIEESHEPLPGQLWRQPLLVQLRLHKVYVLKEIPDTLELPNLQLRPHKAYEVKENTDMLELPNLQELCMDSCWGLASLPANVWQALGGSLRKLQLMRLTKLAALPPGMASLQQLRYLEVDGCELLAELPGCLVGCTQLRQLVLQSCKALAALPAGLEAMPSLKQATIQDCDSLQNVPYSLRRKPKVGLASAPLDFWWDEEVGSDGDDAPFDDEDDEDGECCIQNAVRFFIDEGYFLEGDTEILRAYITASQGRLEISGESSGAFMSIRGYYVPEKWDVYWTIRSACHKAYESMKPGQMVNCIPGVQAMSLKRNFLQTWQQAYGEAAFGYIPRSYLLPQQYWLWRSHLLASGSPDDAKWVLKANIHRGKG
ncbi:hypothetical protein OEZ85_000720 [Tetradesmus obliquus]|uniref:Uncharacterized protein n=1 Tax=Tetradesmus obliquus TaxID=3088 RepID=A0ABY8UJ07_TETOB|nr:hypothetical protein OEZ85_000720 [Tetradesmus obliquus]